MNNIKRFLLVFAVILIISPVITLAEETYKLESSFQFGANEIVVDDEKGEVDIHSVCDFGNFGACNDICGDKGECISPEKCVCDGFGNIVEEEKTESKSFWGNIKDRISDSIKKIAQIFTKQTEDKNLEKVELVTDNLIDVAAHSVVSYVEQIDAGEVMSQEVEQKTQGELEEAINSIDSVSELLKLKSLIAFWCEQKNNGDYEKEDACKEDLMEKLKVAGDKLKEKLVAAIDENDTSYDTFKKIERLRALLMAAESPDGESGSFFSIENIRWAQKEIARKALVWVINRSNTYMSLEDLQWFYSLVAAGSSIYAPGELESGEYKGNHMFPGQQGLTSLRYRARRMLLQKMAEMDICNPDPAELKALQDLLNKPPGCEKLLGNAEACKRIMSGNLESAYVKLFDQDKGDEANDSDPNKAKEPVDCNKKPVITPDFKALPLDEVADVTYEIPEVVIIEELEDPEDVVTEDLEEDYEDETPPEPDPEEICNLSTYPEEIIGYNFTIDGCERIYDDGLRCLANCGWMPPLFIFEQEENLCNETAGGFVEPEIIIPCHPRPEPDPGILQCVNDCLTENI